MVVVFEQNTAVDKFPTTSQGGQNGFVSSLDRAGYTILASSDLIGVTVKTTKWFIQKTGTPTACTFYSKLYNSAGSFVHQWGDGLDSSGVSSEVHTFSDANGYELSEGDYIVLECDTTSSIGSNYFSLKGDYPPASSISGSPHYLNNTWYDGSFSSESPNTNAIVPSLVLDTGAAGPTSTGTRLPPPPLIARF